jgi:hypothetical protein
MATRSKSKNLRERLSYDLSSGSPPGSRFVADVREGFKDFPKDGSRIKRLLYHSENLASAIEGTYIEGGAGGVSLPTCQFARDRLVRAIDDLLHRMFESDRHVVCMPRAIEAETEANGVQNNHAVRAVQPHATLADLEALWRSTRDQRETTDALLKAIEVRIVEMRDQGRSAS